ncbi:DUF3622 domain-containing protein [Shewanella xiamenensis]|jgi:hypothetical protein|uniref:DUF3622 domain-containing protein n=1 Tax=Shewanella xiamenensis TaxID=332186 RepID=A0A073KT75_9GAMM|nr:MULTISPECIES: DUF3622 domain-containing protein [Shewanella]PZP35513.1 MAG: DUF3622 domain-containing protein [Shewanella oneidensis]ASF15695.1 DUF3622 domain-containing protein [Shewanella sp. FDAARGOS_354]KEK29617.1 hypothetical protein SXM_0700 [Shewanella xiamenensis]KPN76161.1 hypothetical protein AEA42_15090 [Shewanella sp. Sh95]MBW0278796.1 hypothetical protein [Shewanella xiamenensis]
MSKGKKYDFRVTQAENGWKTEITRRMTSTKTVVSKSHDGFATEAEAQAWGQAELQVFLGTLVERNKRRSEKQAKAKLAAALAAEAATDADDFDDEDEFGEE